MQLHPGDRPRHASPSPRLRSWWVAATVLLLASQAAGAQPPGPAFSAEAAVTVVELPVEVVRDGEPVRGLTADDFEVREGRRTLPIVGFEVVELLAPVGATETAALAPPPAAARRLFFLLFDFASSDPHRLATSVSSAQKLVADGLAPSDLVGLGIYLPRGELVLLLNFTADRAAAQRTLLAIEATLTGRQAPPAADGVAIDPLRLSGMDARALLVQKWNAAERNVAAEIMADGGPDLDYETIGQMAAQLEGEVQHVRRRHVMALSDGMRGLAEALRAVEGRKSLLLFSEGFSASLAPQAAGGATSTGPGGSDLLKNLRETLDTLRQTGWLIHGVDVLGVSRGTLGADGLFYLANETGGTLVEGTNDLAAGLGDVLARSQHSYLVTVQVEVEADGAFHPLEVRLRVPRRGARLHHRAGYFAPQPFADRSELDRHLEAAQLVLGDEVRNDLAVDLLAVPLRAEETGSTVAVAVEVPLATVLLPGAARLSLEVYGYALDAAGSAEDFFAEVVDLDPRTLGERLAGGGVRVIGTLQVKPGAHRIRVLVRDRLDGRTALLTRQLRVGPPSEAQPRLDALFLPLSPDPWLVARRVDAAFALQGRDVLPAARGRVRGGGEASLLVVGRGLAGEGRSLRSYLLDAAGQRVPGGELELLSLSPGEGGEPDLVVARLRTADLAPGNYQLELRIAGEGGAVLARTGGQLTVLPKG